jgi:hypothetical protein
MVLVDLGASRNLVRIHSRGIGVPTPGPSCPGTSPGTRILSAAENGFVFGGSPSPFPPSCLESILESAAKIELFC